MDCGDDLRDEEWWMEHSEDDFWFDDENPEIFAIWSFWDDYHHGDGDIDMDLFGDWFYDEYGDDLMLDDGIELHENPACYDGGEDWHVMTIDCDYFDFIEYRDTCYINYAHDPCDLANNTCFMPHYDVEGDWQYDNCTELLSDYEGWSMTREVLMWHDTDIDEQLPYIHEYWDMYHDIYDPDWWYYSNISDHAVYSEYDEFMDTCFDQQCEWVDCEEDEQLWDSGDCWKELCYGCDQ